MGTARTRWALSLWARAFRRLARRWTVHSHVRKFCRPFAIEGEENLAEVEGPLLIIANHTGRFRHRDRPFGPAEQNMYDKTTVVAAADRMYRERIKGMWHSLRYETLSRSPVAAVAKPLRTRNG